MNLAALGWNDAWEERLAAIKRSGGAPGRITAHHRDRYDVYTARGEIAARVSGRLRHRATHHSDLPAVGDWVVVLTDTPGDAVVDAVLPRVSCFVRKVAGDRTDEQVVAANVDEVWIVSSLDGDLNPARIDRFLTMVWESGATPVVVLTKTDLTDASEATALEMRGRLPGVAVYAVSVMEDGGLDALREHVTGGRTVALLGSSGVGKSTLVNHLAGRELMSIGAVRESDGKGRHTTTHRQLVPIASGGVLLDTPGMRELQLWSAEDGLRQTFDDIDALARQCRFGDCRHETEPSCAVAAAIASGALAYERLESYRKLQREIAYMERKVDVRAAQEEKRLLKNVMKRYRRTLKGDA